jgi:uncharacterized protein (TIGR02453 family)
MLPAQKKTPAKKKKTASKKKVTKKPSSKKKGTKKSTSKAAQGSPFRKEMFQFLGELGLNNEREWFQANKERYEHDVREPALEFIRQFGQRLPKFSKHYAAVDKKVGGSLMRVYRDTRFSKDKTPYKTNVGIHFRHAAGKNVHAPGLYLHIEIDEIFLGAGMWHPEAEALANIRRGIVESSAKWKRVSRAEKMRAHWNPTGDSLKRPPRGFDAEHPLIDDLKRKDHIVITELKAKELFSKDAVDEIFARFMQTRPYVRFLTESQGLPF